MKRIQRLRTKGWRAPTGAIYVGRPTQWGNPYRLARPQDGTGTVRNHQDLLDVLDAEENIVQDYDIPTAAAHRYVKRKLNLRVASTTGDAPEVTR